MRKGGGGREHFICHSLENINDLSPLGGVGGCCGGVLVVVFGGVCVGGGGGWSGGEKRLY